MSEVKLGEHARPDVSVDIVLLSMIDNKLKVYLSNRINTIPADAFGKLSLAGGYVHTDTDISLMDTVKRVINSKIGIIPEVIRQFTVFSGKERDSRGWSISIPFFAIVPESELTIENKSFFVDLEVASKSCLAFDHNLILKEAKEQLKLISGVSALPCFFLDTKFSLVELKQVYELILDKKLDNSSFRRKITELDLLDECEGEFKAMKTKKAQLYKLKSSVMNQFDRLI